MTGAVPEVVDVSGLMTDQRSWAMPQARSIARYGAGFWSHSALTSFTLASVNDGVLTSACAVSPAGLSSLRFDAGVGQTKAFRELTYYHSGTLVVAPWVEWSDDGSSWNGVMDRAAREAFDAGSGITGRQLAWASAGAHRFWRINFAGANTWTEFHFAEYLGEFSQVREFRVYDMRSGTKKLFLAIPAKAVPTAATPLSLGAITTSIAADWNRAGEQRSDILITVVNSAGDESAGVRSLIATATAADGGQATYVPQKQTTATVTNGLNTSVAVPSGPGFLRLTGATAPYSIAGFSAVANGGSLLVLCNATDQPLTVMHESLSASAALRIRTSTAANVIVAPNGVVVFAYDSSSERWRLFSTPVSRVVDGGGIYGSIDVHGTTNGWAGVRFVDAYEDSTFMALAYADVQGVFRPDANAWSWCFENGTLIVGHVPWSSVISKPTTLDGYGITDAAPRVSPTFTGTPTAPTPATTDNGTALATTAFVRNAITTYGGSLEGVASLSPNSYPSTSLAGLWSGTSTPRGPAVNTTTFFNTAASIVSITGKGKLRFLSLGRATTGDVTLTVTVDGVSIINGVAFYCAGALNTHFNVPVVGGINMAVDPSGVSHLWAVLDEEGIPFESSLSITATVTGTAYVAHAYKLV